MPLPFQRYSHLLLLGLVAFCLTRVGHSESTHPRQKSLTLREHEQIMIEVIERELAHWKPTKENNATPRADQSCIIRDLSGVWLRGGGGGEFDHAKIKLFPLKSGKSDTYRVLFSTGGCEGYWSLERTATYRNGVLLLDHPVGEYNSSIYNRLFTIRTSKGIRLISDSRLSTSRELKWDLSEPIASFANAANSK